MKAFVVYGNCCNMYLAGVDTDENDGLWTAVLADAAFYMNKEAAKSAAEAENNSTVCKVHIRKDTFGRRTVTPYS